jgi:rare lipoprotein A (peptidoglycan hydrolase)
MPATHRATHVLSVGLAVAGLLAATTAVAAAKSASGGTSAGSGSTSAAQASYGQPVPTTVGSTLGSLILTPASVAAGQPTVASGTLAASDAGQPVALEIQSKPGIWVAAATSTVAPDGSYSIPWIAKGVGTYAMRVVSGALASSAAASIGTPQSTLVILKSVIATWYGPGMYGRRTACGEKLTRYIVGVANRKLPCGTPVTLNYAGRELTVPVIDRGPYANGATFDLTSATAQELGITETVSVGYSFVRGQTIAPLYWYPNGATGPSGSSGASGNTGPTAPAGATGATGTDSGGATAPA